MLNELEKIKELKIKRLEKMPENIRRIGSVFNDTITTLWTRDKLNFDLFLYDGDTWYQVE